MTPSESNIVTKITADIEAAASAAERSPLISDLYAFLTATEKRVALEAEDLVPRFEGEAKKMMSAVAIEAKKVVREAEHAI